MFMLLFVQTSPYDDCTFLFNLDFQYQLHQKIDHDVVYERNFWRIFILENVTMKFESFIRWGEKVPRVKLTLFALTQIYYV
jgi:hypothetical protein